MDIATIGFEADTSGLTKGEKGLDSFQTKVESTEASVASMGKSATASWGAVAAASSKSAEIMSKNVGALNAGVVAITKSMNDLQVSSATGIAAGSRMMTSLQAGAKAVESALASAGGVSARGGFGGMKADIGSTDAALRSFMATIGAQAAALNATADSSQKANNNTKALSETFNVTNVGGTRLVNTLTAGQRGMVVLGEAAGVAKAQVMSLYTAMLPLLAVFAAIAVATKVWHAGMKAGDLGEMADQAGVTTDALQALRFEAAQNGVDAAQMDAALRKLTQTMGAAAKGGDEQIKNFQKLGVKLLDAKGNLRSLESVLPEVAKGLGDMEKQTERNALMLEFFGRSGTKMVTMLDSLSGGMGSLIQKAKEQGGVLDKDVIAAWDRLKDQLVKTGEQADVTLAKLGAPIATWALEKVEALLKSINANLAMIDKQKINAPVTALQADVSVLQDRLDAIKQNPSQFGAKESIAALEKQIATAKSAADLVKGTITANEVAMDQLKNQGLPAMNPSGPPGVKDPISSSAAKEGDKLAEAYKKIVRGAEEAIAKYKLEQQTLGQSAIQIATAKNELELFNKVAEAGIKLGPAETARLKDLAKGMAEAEVSAAAAKNVFKEMEGAKQFIEQQNILQRSLGLSAEEAARLKYETELLNRASQNGAIILKDEQITALKAAAGEMAAMEAQTKSMTDAMSFVKDIFHDLFSDLKDALISGKNLWEAFGNAALGVLSKIADKLLNMALDGLLPQLFGGMTGGGSTASGSSSKGGTGGNNILGGLGNMFSGGGLSNMWSQTSDWFSGLFGGDSMARAGQAGSAFFGPAAPSTGLFGSGISGLGAVGAIGGGIGGIMQLMKGGTGNTIGGIGSLIGAGVSLIPGIGQIAGPAIALLSNILPGLFESKPEPPTNRSISSLNFRGGQFATGGGGYGMDMAELGGLGTSMKGLLDLAKVKIKDSPFGLSQQQYSKGDFSNATTFVTGPGGSQMQWGQSSDPQQQQQALDTAAAHVSHQIMLEVGSGISDTMRTGLVKFGLDNLAHAFSMQELQTAVGEISAFEDAVSKFGKTTTDAQSALDQIDESMKGLFDTAEKYGLGTGAITTEKQRHRAQLGTDFASGIQKQLMDPLTAALTDIGDERTNLLRNNSSLMSVAGYQDQAANIEALYAKKRLDILKQFNEEALATTRELLNTGKALLSSLNDYIKQLLPGGGLAGEGLQAQLAGLTGSYNAARAQAFASPLDEAKVGEFMRTGQALLEFQKSYFGGDERYQQARMQALEDAKAVQAAVAKGVSDANNTIVSKGGTADPTVAELLKTQKQLADQIAALMVSQAELNAQLRRKAVNGG